MLETVGQFTVFGRQPLQLREGLTAADIVVPERLGVRAAERPFV